MHSPDATVPSRVASPTAALPWLGLALFSVAFVASAAVWGLPWSRDRLAIWVLAGLAAVSLGDLRGYVRGLTLDWAPLFGLLFLYDLARGYADGIAAGVYIWPQLRFDELLGGGSTPTVLMQQALWDASEPPRWYDYVVWAVYTSHFFVTLLVAAVLWRLARPRFQRFAASIVSLTLFGFATYVLVPAMPPWLASANGYLEPTQRIVPVMWQYVGVAPAAMVFEGGNQYANDIAALPSLHAAYPVLLMLFFWRGARRPLRLLLTAYPLAMAIALVYSAEHYVADILLGWAYAVATTLLVAATFERWSATRSRRTQAAL